MRVPESQVFGAVAGAGPNSQFETQSSGVIPRDNTLEQAGQTLQKTGDRLARIQIDANNEANRLRVDDAVNNVRQQAIDLAYNQESGYMTLQGQQALERPDQKSLMDEYGERFNNALQEVESSLSNDQQRLMFRRQASRVATQFQSGVERHMLEQYTKYHSSVADGAAQLALQEAQLGWNDPERVDEALNGYEDPESGERHGGLKQAIMQKARLNGLSSEETQAQLNEMESRVHSSVIQSALANNQVDYAEGYFQKYKSSMTGKNILEVRKLLNETTDARVAEIAVQNTTREYATAFVPDDMERFYNIVEPNGGQTNGTDQTGASATQGGGTGSTPPGIGDTSLNFERAKDDSPQELERSKRDYLTTLLRNYEDPSQALAAYRTDKNTVDMAMAAAEKAGDSTRWSEFLPKNVRDSVEKDMNKFASGVGSREVPTQIEMVNAALAKLSDNASPATRASVKEQAEKQYKALVASRDQKADEALAEAQRLLVDNGGSFSELPATVKMNLSKYDPAKYKEALTFADSVRQDDDVATDTQAYIEAVSNPDTLVNMTDAQFNQYATTKFSKADRDEIIKLRAGVLSGTSNKSVDVLDNQTIDRTLGTWFNSMGITKKDNADQMAAVQRFVRDDLYNVQRAEGRRLTPREVEERINFLSSRTAMTERGWWSGDAENKGIFKFELDNIPDETQNKLRLGLQARGISNPTDDDIMRAFWSLRIGKYNRQ